MRNILSAICIAICASFAACASNTGEGVEVNLGFEKWEKGAPEGWVFNFGDSYTFTADSTCVHGGKYSAAIEYVEGQKAEYAPTAIRLPENYDGKTLTVTAWVKTENITNGYAAIWARIDPDVAFDNMMGRGLTGTNDWTMCRIDLPMRPNVTDGIFVGAMLIGNGKMWVDDFKITIDGKDISLAQTFEREYLPAEVDKEFDGGSGIVIPTPDPQLSADLALLGRVWGFLKYHHPAIAKGQYNWDYELMRILPEYLDAGDRAGREKVLEGWIDQLGDVPVNKPDGRTGADVFITPDHSWIDGGLSPQLAGKLRHIYDNRAGGRNYYVELTMSIKNPKFQHENLYAQMSYPDDGFRLLSLFRFWNSVNYFFPNRYLTDKDWDTVLDEYVPVFLNAADRLEYELAALRIIGEVCDTHANLWQGNVEIDKLRGDRYAPFRVAFVQDRLVVVDVYNPELVDAKAISIGDVITRIDGKRVGDIVDSVAVYYPASNHPVRLRDIASDMLRSAKESLTVEIAAPQGAKQVEVALYPKHDLNWYDVYKVNADEPCYKILDGNIGYITLANITEPDVANIKRELAETKGIVIDIRNYPSAFMPFTLAPWFVEGEADFVKFTVGSTRNPGEFTFVSGPKIITNQTPYANKVVVLVNEISQSQAEYTAMAFRAGINTTIVGSTTAGADGDVSSILLPGGLATYISGIGIYYPDGGQTQRIGIVPDVVVTPTVAGIKAGRDELLEKAVEIINRQYQ